MADENQELAGMKAVLDETIKAMGRLKERMQELDNRFKIVEAMIPGFQQRVENLEKAFEHAFKDAQENVEKFMAMLEGGDEPSDESQNDNGSAEAVTE